MLILTRQLGEAVIIGDDIVVRVLEIKGSSVRLGIEAPKDIPVYRDEIYEAARQKRRAPGDPETPPHNPDS